MIHPQHDFFTPYEKLYGRKPEMEQNISEKSTIETLIPTNDIPESDTNLSAKTTEQTINYD